MLDDTTNIEVPDSGTEPIVRDGTNPPVQVENELAEIAVIPDAAAAAGVMAMGQQQQLQQQHIRLQQQQQHQQQQQQQLVAEPDLSVVFEEEVSVPAEELPDLEDDETTSTSPDNTSNSSNSADVIASPVTDHIDQGGIIPTPRTVALVTQPVPQLPVTDPPQQQLQLQQWPALALSQQQQMRQLQQQQQQQNVVEQQLLLKKQMEQKIDLQVRMARGQQQNQGHLGNPPHSASVSMPTQALITPLVWQGHSVQSGTSNQGSTTGRKNASFLIKQNRQNVILDEGNRNIPFSAIKELHKYEVFVTNILPTTDLEHIKRHLSSMLHTRDIVLKPMSKNNASSLSFGLFCRSDRDDLNFKLPGLWPAGTGVYKWKARAMDTRAGYRNANTPGPSRAYSSQGRRGLNNNQGYNQGTQSRNTRDGNSASGFNFTRPDQVLLHAQNA